MPSIVSALIGGLLCLATGKGPNWIFLRPYQGLWPEEFCTRHPQLRPIPLIHRVSVIAGSFIFLMIGLRAGLIEPFERMPALLYLAFLVIYWTTGVGIINALFELIVGVSPVPVGYRKTNGMVSRGIWIYQYIANSMGTQQIRKAGGVRLLLAVSIIVGLKLLQSLR